MNCQDFKIWIDKAGPEDLRNPDIKYLEHINSCLHCKKDYTSMLHIFELIDYQKNRSLSPQQSQKILENLTNRQISRPYLKLSKLAAIAIIIVGLITGMVAGNLLSGIHTENNESPWASEFSMLSDNSEYESYLFD